MWKGRARSYLHRDVLLADAEELKVVVVALLGLALTVHTNAEIIATVLPGKLALGRETNNCQQVRITKSSQGGQAYK
jgi:hypothetical protein